MPGKKPSGGHWNSGIAVLRNNGLIEIEPAAGTWRGAGSTGRPRFFGISTDCRPDRVRGAAHTGRSCCRVLCFPRNMKRAGEHERITGPISLTVIAAPGCTVLRP